jgi:alpha-D-xyloside xylohydrolase
MIGVQARSGSLTALLDPSLPFALEDVDIVHHEKESVVLIPLGSEEHLYGLGLQFHRTEFRGRTEFLRVNSDPKMDGGETHAPVPFYISSAGYGVLIDTSNIVTLYLGSCVRSTSGQNPMDSTDDPAWLATPLSDAVEAVVPNHAFTVYIFAGLSMRDVVCRYNLFNGGGVLPPRWALGFWHRVPSVFTQEEVVAEVDAFTEHDIALDVVGLEPGWHSTSYPDSYTFSAKRFPNPSVFFEQMKARSVRVNLWEHPWVSPKADIYEALKPLSGSHTVWGGLAPDYSLEQAQEILINHHQKNHLNLGVSGYKIDECDGSELTDCSWMFPGHATFPSGLDGRQMRQLYGLLLQKTMAELFRRQDQRTFGLVRASGAAASTLPFVVYSDLYDHRHYITALYNSSFSGLLWTPEVRRAKSGEEWLRRIQSVVFSPLALLNAWGDATKPWTFADVAEQVKFFIDLRLRLVPYLYATFAQYHNIGLPPIRSMEIAFGDVTGRFTKSGHKEFDTTRAPYGRVNNFSFTDQYMLGDAFLVAPMFTGEKERQVFLPEGRWFDFFTHQVYEGGRFVSYACPLDRMPVFVPDGAVIPLYEKGLKRVPESSTTIEVLVFGRKDGGCMLLDDDGQTFAFERGDFRTITITGDGTLEGWVPEGSYYSGFTFTYVE